ncbi:MAG: uroporphyrinogen-III synthase [Prevotella sp.]|nr:uroporphyrinogen-III synthase [Prevotella sp.]
MRNEKIRVLITAPEGYALRLAKALKTVRRLDGARLCPVGIPMIATWTDTESEEFAQFVSSLSGFDYIVFTSRRAIAAVSEVMAAGKVLREQLRGGCCAIGKDNDFLRSELHVEPCFMAEEPSPVGIVRELEHREDIRGKRIAVLGPRVENLTEPDTVPDFLHALAEAGMEVTFVPAYVTGGVGEKELLRAADVLRERSQLTYVAFTSGAEAQVFHRLSALMPDYEQVMRSVSVVCFGPYTAKCCRKEGLRVDFVSKDFSSFQAFAKALP